MEEKFLKYGGVKFEQKANAQEINKFVSELPNKQRESLYEVSKALTEEGLISTLNQMTTIDDEMIEFQETDGKIGK